MPMRSFSRLTRWGGRADRCEFARVGMCLCLYIWVMFRASPLWLATDGPIGIDAHLHWAPLLGLGLLLSGWAWVAMVRRLHDLGRNGWTLLWALTGIAALPLWHTLSFKAGTPDANAYGPPPTPRRLSKIWLLAHGLCGLLLVASVATHLSMRAYQSLHWHHTTSRLKPDAPAMEVMVFHSRLRLYVAQIVCQDRALQLDVLGYQRPVRPFAAWPALQGELRPLKAHIKSGVERLPTQWESSHRPLAHAQSFDFLASLKPEKLYGNQIVLSWPEEGTEAPIHLYLTQADLIEFMQSCR